MRKDVHREVTPLEKKDCFLVFDKRRKEFSFPIHFHPEFEINFIEGAAGAKRTVGDHTATIGNKELILVGPNLYHGYENYKNDTSKTIHEVTIQFPRDLFDDAFLNRNLIKPIKDLLNNSSRGILFPEETIQIIEPQLMAIVNKNGFDSFLEFQSLLYNLTISRDQLFLTDLTFQRQSDFHNSKRIEKVYNYIKENYDQKLKIEDAAQLINMSIVSFSRFIKQRTGKSFVDFVNSYRISIASQAMVETNKSISEICYDCGFNNISNFNRVFRKKQGCTPSEFRDNFNGTSNMR